ncbi:beta-lactamase [Staphylococcus aureus]|uniref:Beta-lactamase n=1 Tax=Staphylococcus aureus TaxID=1280 RepID=A0A380E380_STAAU|nr:beta-lactamase [Staphylococcus aureus]
MEKVKDSLIDSQIISGNEHETVKVTFTTTSGQSNSVQSTANHDTVSDTPSNFSKLNQIDLTKVNISDLNTTIDATKLGKIN